MYMCAENYASISHLRNVVIFAIMQVCERKVKFTYFSENTPHYIFEEGII